MRRDALGAEEHFDGRVADEDVELRAHEAKRHALANNRREYPSTPTSRNTRTSSPAMLTHFSPESICICAPGSVSNRTVGT